MKAENEAPLLVTSAIVWSLWVDGWEKRSERRKEDVKGVANILLRKVTDKLGRWIQASGDFEEGLAFGVALTYNSSKFQVPHTDAL